MDFCGLYWLPSTLPLLKFEEFPVLCDLLGGIAHLLLYEENARYLLSQDSLLLEEWACGLSSVSWMFLPQKLSQELVTYRNQGP